MKTRRSVFLLGLAAVLLLGAFIVPAASASPAVANCPPVYHRVVRGENLSQIAARYGVTVWQVQQWNGIQNIDRIYAGSTLVIHPTRCAQPRPTPRPTPQLPGPCSGPVCPLPPIVIPTPTVPVLPIACTDQRAQITSPVNNQQVDGWLTIRGNATHENFKFYKLEWGAGANPSDWHWFFGGEFPIWQGVLGALNTDILTPGTYTIKVTVVDRTSNYPPPCQVRVVVR